METTVLMFGAVGAVILIAALISGLLDRIRVPSAVVFIALGALFGPYGLGLYDYSITSTTVTVVAVLSLVLVLFTDSVGVNFRELRTHLKLAFIILGPGTALTAVIIAVAAHFLLHFGWAESTILGAALSSTDPVLLRSVLRSPAVPTAARQGLRIESGMNDAVLLPAVLVAVALLMPTNVPVGVTSIILKTLVVGGAVGAIIGYLAVRAMELIRRHIGIRRDYESLYVLAIALTAFAGAEAVHGSGFIAAFAAGLTIARLDIELCECFYDYGEASAEMALLFAFVILGNSALWRGLSVVSLATIGFAFVALFARTIVLAIALSFLRIDRRSRWITVWFGPRGLSSLLLVLLAVFAGAPNAQQLFDITALCVLFSIVIHGGSQVFLRSPRVLANESGLRITVAELKELQARGEEVVILDVRADSSYRRTLEQPVGAVRVAPERGVDEVRTLGLPPGSWLILYCT